MRLFFFFLIFLLSSYAHAQQRLALVIGNSNYSKIDYLNNPINDAEDIAAKLTNLNFSVTLKKDQTHPQMMASIRKFSKSIASGDIALFYYAGHGMQSSDATNYLIPLQADINDEADLNYQAINANWILDNLKRASPALKIMILDACRNNPFRSFRSSDSRGLAPMNSNSGTIIAYAAGAGKKANDGKGRNGLFTAELLQWLDKPNIEAGQMFTKVSWKVSTDPNSQGQSPFLAIQAPPPFCFAGCGKTPPKPPEIVDSNSTAISKPTEVVTLKPAEIITPAISRQAFEPKMKLIKGGSFKMGCVSGLDCYKNEKVHKVSINDFWIGQYEVTFDEWQNCVNDGGCQSNTEPDDEGWGKGQRPVINVNWHDANEYAAWLNKKTGKNYRLPTEAEWEYAARAGSSTKYSFGNNEAELCQYANHADQSTDYVWRNKKCSDGIAKKTAQVGSYQANPWKLYDMIGNAWEWTCSAYPKDNQYNGLESKCTNKNDSRSRMLRGGSWNYLPESGRSASRGGSAATRRHNFVGFRLSRTR